MSAPAALHPAQSRILTVLVVAQVLSGAGLSAGITVGALLAEDLLGATSLAGLPSTLFTIGAATAAAGTGRLSDRMGRRAGLTAGYGLGALGALGVVAAATSANAVLLFGSLFVYGAGTATSLQARYAGADLATPRGRGRALSAVLAGTTVGAVAGPNLVGPMGDLAEAWQIPALGGPFVLAAVAYAAAASVLWTMLRPDPLLTARALASVPATPDGNALAADPAAGLGTDHGTDHGAGRGTGRGAHHGAAGNPGAGAEPGSRERGRRLMLGTAIMVTTQLVMVAIMTMTPVHMRGHGHSLGAAGLVIAVHVAGMFLPSPLSGMLVDRFGRPPVAVASGCTLLASGLLAATAPPESVPLLAVALALLGLGWNLGLVSGTAIITDAAPIATRARTQGLVDVAIATAGAGGGLASGMIMAVGGYPALTVAGGLISLAIIPAVAYTARAAAVSEPSR